MLLLAMPYESIECLVSLIEIRATDGMVSISSVFFSFFFFHNNVVRNSMLFSRNRPSG